MADALVTLVSVPAPFAGDMVHVTPWLARSLLTVAEMSSVSPASSDCPPSAGVTVTAIAGTVAVAEAVFVVSLTDVAVRVTTRFAAGGEAGAVYVVAAPLDVEPGETEPHGGAEHDSVHVTPRFAESLLTVAVACAVWLASTLAGFRETDTLIDGGGGGGVTWPPPHPKLPSVATATSRIVTSGIRFGLFTLGLFIPELLVFAALNFHPTRGRVTRRRLF